MGSGRVPGALFVLSIFENALRDARRSLCMRARRMIVALVDLMEDEGVGKGEVVAGMGLKECVSGRIVNTRQVRNCLVEKWGAWADCSGGVKSGEEAVRVIRLHFAKCKRKTCRGRVSRREIRNTHRRTHKSSAS